jgi:hypothetical protein
MSKSDYNLQGMAGGIVLSGADSITGTFRWIQAVTDTVLLTDTGETAGNLTDIANLDNVTLAAGIGIGGLFSKVQISSGVCIAYYA